MIFRRIRWVFLAVLILVSAVGPQRVLPASAQPVDVDEVCELILPGRRSECALPICTASVVAGGHYGSYWLGLDDWFEGNAEATVDCDSIAALVVVSATVAATPNGAGSKEKHCPNSSGCSTRAEGRTAEAPINCVGAIGDGAAGGIVIGPAFDEECYSP